MKEDNPLITDSFEEELQLDDKENDFPFYVVILSEEEMKKIKKRKERNKIQAKR